MNKQTPLKPVVFVSGTYTHNKQNTSQQLMLLKALRITQDPKKLRQLIGVKTVADVFRTLDKIAIRKEFHEAFARSGLSFDSIVGTLKTEMTDSEKGSDRIKAAQILLKSFGLDKYEDSTISGGSWEDEILRASDGEVPPLMGAYDVDIPEIPESVKKQHSEQEELGRSLYE